MKRNLRAFVDSNVLFSAAAGGQSDFQLFWEIPGVDVLTSNYSIGEVSRNLENPQDRARLWRLIYRSHLVQDGEGIELPDTLQLAPKDIPILRSAIAGEADFLITGDRNHFGRLYGTSVLNVHIEAPLSFKARFPIIFRQAGGA